MSAKRATGSAAPSVQKLIIDSDVEKIVVEADVEYQLCSGALRERILAYTCVELIFRNPYIRRAFLETTYPLCGIESTSPAVKNSRAFLGWHFLIASSS